MKKILVWTLLGLLLAASAFAKAGASKNLGKKDWAAVHGITTLGKKMYVASGLTLLVADASGKSADLYPNGSPDWSSPELLCALDGKIYLIAGVSLYEVDPKSGKSKGLGGRYRYPGGIAGLNGKLYVASDDALWLVDRSTGKYVKFTDHDWYNVHALVALDDKLYLISNDSLFEVDAAAKVTQVSGTFSNVNGMTALNGKLYIFTDEPAPALHQVEKTGKDTSLPIPKGWDGTTGINGMTALGDKVYLVMPNMGSTITLFTVDTKH